MKIAEAIKSLNSLKVADVANEVVEDNSEVIVRTLQKQLEVRHKSSDGKIGTYKSKSYVKWKSKQPGISPNFDGKNVDLFLSGDFNSSIVTEIGNNTYEQHSRVNYESRLKDLYGEEILELDEVSKKEVSKKVTPIYFEKLSKDIKK